MLKNPWFRRVLIVLSLAIPAAAYAATKEPAAKSCSSCPCGACPSCDDCPMAR